ncbi:signal peptidase II [Lactobacillus rodentium]|uniref:Lipoprotein signal peptidase n=1 Tax=Lactobacillus rodentium TaxID=947835 RepID=A0A2Z6T7L5_9LACO|nr:signal peptidase II [Lactobacillus rodentium]MCR1894995.1 signal peptidase II [Lactobacillus rodentium]GBG05296.1 lipoprotein signal peptidase [Lactobacillus rodentium]
MKKSKQALYLLLSLIVVGIDQLIKFNVVRHLRVGESKTIIPNILSFYYLRNNGAAWNIFSGQMYFFYLISVIAIIAVLYFLFNPKYKSKTFDIGLALILGGIIGNFIDRVRLHYVVDMMQLDFINFNIFNFADSCITVGVILVFIYLLFIDGKDKKKA